MRQTIRKQTPEEKLLNIIEGSEGKNRIQKKKKKIEIPRPKLPAIKITDLTNAIKNVDLRQITLPGVNKFLIGVAMLLTLLLIFFLRQAENAIPKRFEDLKNSGSTSEHLDLNINEDAIPDPATYLSATAKNNPFHVLPQAVKAEPEKQAEQSVNLKLVGILWLDAGQAIIEDTSTQKTHLVYEGDTFLNFTVVEITQSEVKLRAQDGSEKILR